jgi:hypothetical protein
VQGFGPSLSVIKWNSLRNVEAPAQHRTCGVVEGRRHSSPQQEWLQVSLAERDGHGAALLYC